MRYQREQRQMKCCEPRDLIERCLDICRYENRPLVLTPHLLELAWANYFGTTPKEHSPAMTRVDNCSRLV